MTHVLKIGDGTTEQSLIDQDPVFLLSYDIRNGDGSGTVVESAEILVRSSAHDDTLSATRTIQRLLVQAERRQVERTVSRVYVTQQLDGDSDEWRSEILRGSLSPIDEAIRWRGAKAGRYVLTWERQDYWEGDERELPLFNPGQAGAHTGGAMGLLLGAGAGTGGLQIVNNPGLTLYDGTSPLATVILPGEAITGTLETPLRFEIENDFNSGTDLTEVWIGYFPLTLDVGLTLALQGEDALGTPTTAAGGGWSGGSRLDENWSGSGSWSAIASYTISNSLLEALKGERYLLIMRTGTSDHSDTIWRWKLGSSAGTEIFETTEGYQFGSGQIHEMGTLRLPPYDVVGNTAPLTLFGEGRVTTAGSTGYCEADYILFLPADGVRKLTRGPSVARGVAYTETVEDNPIENRVMVTTTASQTLGHWYATGHHTKVRPGVNYGLTFLLGDEDGDAVITRTATIRAYYRARRSTVES